MRAVWKFEIPLDPVAKVNMPTGAEVVHVGAQEGRLCLWAIVNTIEPLKERNFLLSWTGQSIPSLHKHLGTVQIGDLVWHVFEEDRASKSD